MLTFGDKVVGKVQIEKELTESDIETIIVGGFEGGINHWAGFNRSENSWYKDKPKDEPLSTYATKVLLDGGEIKLHDKEGTEDDSSWILNLQKVLDGYKLNCIKRSWDSNLDTGDAITYDCIIQYALFEDLVYG